VHALLNGVAYDSYAGVTDVGARDRSRRLFGRKKQLKNLNRGCAIAKVEREPGTIGRRSRFSGRKTTVYQTQIIPPRTQKSASMQKNTTKKLSFLIFSFDALGVCVVKT